MDIEIERKFLVVGDGWRRTAGAGRRVRQGYVSRAGGVTVRVRCIGARGILTVKGVRDGIARPEFEYEIPLEDAEAMLGTLCLETPLEKVRHEVTHGGLVWEVDVYEGVHAGLTLAEVELEAPDQAIALPDWVGEEVTHDLSYRSTALARRAALIGRLNVCWPDEATA